MKFHRPWGNSTHRIVQEKVMLSHFTFSQLKGKWGYNQIITCWDALFSPAPFLWCHTSSECSALAAAFSLSLFGVIAFETIERIMMCLCVFSLHSTIRERAQRFIKCEGKKHNLDLISISFSSILTHRNAAGMDFRTVYLVRLYFWAIHRTVYKKHLEKVYRMEHRRGAVAVSDNYIQLNWEPPGQGYEPKSHASLCTGCFHQYSRHLKLNSNLPSPGYDTETVTTTTGRRTGLAGMMLVLNLAHSPSMNALISRASRSMNKFVCEWKTLWMNVWVKEWMIVVNGWIQSFDERKGWWRVGSQKIFLPT